MAPLIEAKDWGWRHAGRQSWAVKNLNLEVEAGERILLLGASGAGKSTFLHALAGVLGAADEGTATGTMTIGGKRPIDCRGQIGLVMQDPNSQVVLAKVGDDVAFGCENLGVPREEIWPRVEAALKAVSLDVGLDRSTSALSGGQLQRLAIAGALAMDAQILLLDEPTANLDPVGIQEVRAAIENVTADRQRTLIVIEHRVQVWADLVDRVVVLGPDGIIADGPPALVLETHRDELLAAGVWVPNSPLPPARTYQASATADLWTRELTTGYSAQYPISRDLEVQIPAGLSTCITGPNGAGKTTLGLTLVGLLEPLAGEVLAAQRLRPPASRKVDPAHPITWTSKQLLTRIGTVFQHPEHQFVAGTVREELAAGPLALGMSRPQVSNKVDELLAQLHLEKLAHANPFTLSGGEKRRLSVGTVLATEPQVILLDEPTFGQDRNTWTDLVLLIQEILGQGRTIVSVTHDDAYLQVLGENHLEVHP